VLVCPAAGLSAKRSWSRRWNSSSSSILLTSTSNESCLHPNKDRANKISTTGSEILMPK
jgi:hypothetical protein